MPLRGISFMEKFRVAYKPDFMIQYTILRKNVLVLLQAA